MRPTNLVGFVTSYFLPSVRYPTESLVFGQESFRKRLILEGGFALHIPNMLPEIFL